MRDLINVAGDIAGVMAMILSIPSAIVTLLDRRSDRRPPSDKKS